MFKKAISKNSTISASDYEFPNIKYFSNRKIRLPKNSFYLPSKQAEMRKYVISSPNLHTQNSYKSFKKDSKNPALGTQYLKEKYPHFFNKYFVNSLFMLSYLRNAKIIIKNFIQVKT